MKKRIIALFFAVVLVIAIALFLGSCNKRLFDFKYTYRYVHVFATGKCYEIKNWNDYEDGDQLQVEIKDCGVCLFHSNQIVLIEKECPFCGQHG